MEGKKQQTAAAMAGMSERSARKWQCGPLPSETKQERRWRTRPDPFDGVWEEEILPLLRGEAAGRLRATTSGWRRNPPAGSAPPSSAPCNADYRTGEHSTVRIRRSTSPRSIHLAGRFPNSGGISPLNWLSARSSRVTRPSALVVTPCHSLRGASLSQLALSSQFSPFVACASVEGNQRFAVGFGVAGGSGRGP